MTDAEKLADCVRRLARAWHDLAVARAELNEALEALRDLHEAVADLTRESRGVDGLHRNGDLALWDELLPGGRYEEWLAAMSPAAAILAKHGKGEPAL